MVFYNKLALKDIEEIFIGLVTWTTKDNFQQRMALDAVWKYRNELFDEGFKLDKLHFHFKATYEIHKQFGQYIHRYDRNKRTQWYYIYNKDHKDDIYIEKIINNYITAE